MQASSRDSVDINEVLSYELAPVPTSIFTDTGDLKLVKLKQLQSAVSADNILAHQMVAASEENQKGISVVSDDTDVFVLLLYHYQAQNLSLLVVKESLIKEGVVIDIRQTVQRNNDIVPDLIPAHALSGCDTLACCFGIDKVTTAKILRSGFHFHTVGYTDTELPAVIQEATTIVSACYGYPKSKIWKHAHLQACI